MKNGNVSMTVHRILPEVSSLHLGGGTAPHCSSASAAPAADSDASPVLKRYLHNFLFQSNHFIFNDLLKL